MFLLISFISLLLAIIVWAALRQRRHHRRQMQLPTYYPPETQPNKQATPDKLTRLPSDEERAHIKEQEEEQIVGIREPVGFWSRKIFNEMIPYITAKLEQEKGGIGYWQRLVLKQRQSPSKGYQTTPPKKGISKR